MGAMTTTTNIQKIEAAYANTLGRSHTLSFNAYLANALKQHNITLERCEIPPMSLEDFCKL
jgi:hypothetical protein